MQFNEKQDRKVYYQLLNIEDLDYKLIFDKMRDSNTNQIALLMSKSFFWNEEVVLNSFISDLSSTEVEFQEEFEDYVLDHKEIYQDKVLAIEGYYKRHYSDFKALYEYDALVILYLIIRDRKNIDGIKSLIKVGRDYEL